MSINNFLTLFSTLFLISCSQVTGHGDRRIPEDEAPKVLSKLKKDHPDIKFYKKTQEDGTIHFEAKYDLKEKEVSITYDDKNNFVDKESDIEFSDLLSSVREKIQTYLKDNYPGHKVLETENRQTPTENLIDVEIRHDSSKSGYWELTFTEDGVYRSREIENFDIPLTHN